MKKSFKRTLLSTLATAAVVFASTATVLLTAEASDNVAPAQATTFEMVDGAAIRLGTPNGLRFITEMDASAYEDLMTEELNVQKQMGMFIVPYDYLSDASRYSNGVNGVNGKNYENITTKLDLVFYKSDGSVNKIYQEGDKYRANGVITNLKLKNYDRSFVGIAYIKETFGSSVTYTYADFEVENDVRSAAYVAIEAYDDYKDSDTAKLIMENYVYGAHLDTYLEGAVSEKYDDDGKLVYMLDDEEYYSLEELASEYMETDFSLEVNQSPKALLLGAQASANATIYNGSVGTVPLTFNDVHAVWSSSNENVVKVDKNGVITAVNGGSATITASFLEAKTSFNVTSIAFDGTFETESKAPSYFTGSRVSALSIVEMDGSKVMQATTTSDSTSDVGVHIKLELLHAIFADPDVDYMAFDLKSGATKTGSKVYYHNDGSSWTQYENGTFDSIDNSFKTYYFTRAEYNDWVAKNVTNGRFVMIGGGLVCGGENFYIDNIRGITEEEKTADFYSFETGGVRTNNGNQPLLYLPNGGQWELAFNNLDSTTAKFTSEIVSDGNRAFTFTKKAGDTKLSFNHNTDTTLEKTMRAAGYVTFDIYAPKGSDACMKWGNYKSAPLKTGAWNTVYVQIDASNNDLIYLYDSTASTYVVDNIQFMTEEEYFEKAYGFESGAVTIRSDSAAGTAGVFYWYAGADRRKNTYSFAATGSPVDPHFNSENTHSGEYSLSFKKTGNVNLQMRADSEAYARLHNGFSFWIYSTIGINGKDTSDFVNYNGQTLNGGAGISIPANTWTKVTLTKDDIKQATLGTDTGCLFLKIGGSTNGTYYIDDIQPLTSYTATFDAGIGSLATTSQEMVYDGAYTLPTPDSYVDFLGWYDDEGNLVPSSGIWDKKGSVTLTARYGDKLSFEGGFAPSYMTTNTSMSVVDMDTVDGSKALKISGSNGSPNLTVPLSFISYFFEDSNVEYIAFNAKTGYCETNNFRRVTWRSNNTFAADCYEYDNGYNKIKGDSWKTYYFSRTDYDHWVDNLSGATATSQFIASGGVATDDFIYVDYIRPMTADEYLASIYSFEGGSVRNDGNAVYMYMPNAGNTWQWVFTQSSIAAVSATSEIVSDGNRAISFTLKPNVTSNFRFNSATCVMAQDLMKTGYYAFDLYIPEGANASLTSSIGGNYKTTVINEGGWRTVYSATAMFMELTDTTGSTYVIDNMRSVTAEEYKAAINGFELGTGGIRQTELAGSNVFYYYMNNGTDYNGVKASVNFVGGSSGATLSNPRFSNVQAHSGTTSLAFDKTNGTMSFGMHDQSKNYSTLKNGFTFWIYSTVGLNGTTANNFVDGNGNKFGASGMNVPANTWTQVTIAKKNFNGTTFLKLAGSTAGTIYIDDFEAATYVEPEHYYNAQAEWEEEGVLHNLTLEKSTHSLTGNNADTTLPKEATDTEDMSYYRFSGNYGLNDYLVFDFTGNNFPILSFFNTSVTNTIYNHAQDASAKGWLVTNGMMTNNGLPYGGYTGAHANRITLCGPYNISYAYDDNGTNQAVTQVRTSIGSAADPSPIAMAMVNGYDQYRVIVGWVVNGSNSSQMNLRLIAWNLTTGEKLVDYNHGGVAKADWTGDIALYGHFGMETKVDKVYPIVEDSLDEALELYTPAMLSYKATWDGNGATLAKSTVSGASTNVSYPTNADMSYIAFNGKYGSGDYVVFDMTGDNMPIVSFFNNTITNTMYNNNGTGASATVKDESVTGWIWSNGLYQNDGSVYGGAKDTNAHWSRLTLIGKQKIIGFDQNTNTFRSNLGSASDVNPLSIRALQNVTDTYRIILGIRANGTNSIYVDMGAINMVTGAQVYKYSWSISTGISAEGSIMLYGQIGKTTVLDSVFGIEEDTTLDALMAKYAKDNDYSDEAAVTLDRYGYSSITDGTYKIDSTSYCSKCGTKISDSHKACVDFRTEQFYYDTYAAAGFNVMLPQTAMEADAWSTTSVYMDKAAAAGLKVILTDWHIQIISTPVKVKEGGIQASDSTYKPWVLASDVNSDGTGKTPEVQAYLDALSANGIAVDKTRFANQNALDSFLMSNIKNYKDHPAFYGVMLGDEPCYQNAYCYGLVYRSLKRIMPSIYVQYNLLPLEQTLSTVKYRYPGLANKSSATNAQLEEAYKQYVTAFLDSMGTDYIQYDDYPFKSAEEGVLFWKETVPYIDNTSLRNIQLIAQIAKERDLSVKVVTQSSLMRSNGSSGPIRIRQINESDARWLNNYLLGNGVKQINYFTYWTKASNSSSGEYYEDGGAFVNKDGTTTAVYNFMKEIMEENTAFAPTISHFDYNESQICGNNTNGNLDNAHINWSSDSTFKPSSLKNYRWITGITESSGNGYVLLTELYDAEKYNYMYMVMNTVDPYSEYTNGRNCTQNVTITLDSSVKSFYVYDQSGNRTLVSGNTYTVSLTAGQAVYIMPYAFA